MIPSRGLAQRVPAVALRRHLQSQHAVARSFSSNSPAPRLQSSSLLSSSLPRSNVFASTSVFAAAPASRSFSLWGYGKKSTNLEEPVPAPAAPSEESVIPPEPLKSTESLPPSSSPVESATGDVQGAFDPSSLDNILNASDILSLPEGIGYLHTIGLDFGWGPTTVMQWVLEHIHVWTGLGWGGSIVATVLILRAAALWPQIQGMKTAVKMRAMMRDSRMTQAKELLGRAVRERQPALNQQATFIQQTLRKEYGVTRMGPFWNLLSIPFGFGLFRLVAGMARIPVPSMETGGFLWFQNLAIADPLYLLPVASGALMYLGFLMNRRSAGTSAVDKIIPGLSVFVVILTAWLSAGVNLMGVVTGLSMFTANFLLSLRPVREFVGLPTNAPPASSAPVYQAPRATDASPKEPKAAAETKPNLNQRFQGMLQEGQKSMKDNMNKYTGGLGDQSSAKDKAEAKRKEDSAKREKSHADKRREEFNRRYKGGQ